MGSVVANCVLEHIPRLDAALEEGVYMLRQNEHEYEALSGKKLTWPDEIESYAKGLVEKGQVQAMVVSHGGDGSLMATKDGVFSAPSFKVKASSAVGAGDSFVGGLLTALARGDDPTLTSMSGSASEPPRRT